MDNLDKYPVPRDSLFYLSCHTLDRCQFGEARLCREVTDRWLSCELSFAGIKFNPNHPDLTEAEIGSIPGASAVLNSVDTLELDCLVRRGSSFIIHADEEKKWTSLSSTCEEFGALKKNHDIHFKDCLVNIISSPQASEPASAAPTGGASGISAAADEEEEEVAEDGDAQKYLQHESLEALEKTYKIVKSVASEIAGVKILRDEGGKTFLLSETSRQLCRGVQLGGYGTGQYAPVTAESASEGIEFAFPEGDKTKVQVEESSIKKDSTANPTMTLYQLLILLERQFKLSAHKISYAEIARSADDSGRDAFTVKLTRPMMYKFVDDGRGESGEALTKKAKKGETAKAIFRFKNEAVEKSSAVRTAFRFRYEKVGQSLKLMKPYVILAKNLKLEAKKPLEACLTSQTCLLGTPSPIFSVCVCVRLRAQNPPGISGCGTTPSEGWGWRLGPSCK